MININTLLLVLISLCSIPKLLLTTYAQHVMVTGDGGVLKFNQKNPSEVHIHSNSPSVTVHVHSQHQHQMFPDQYTQQTYQAPTDTFTHTWPRQSQPDPCQDYIDQKILATREKNEYALHISSLVQRIRQLEHENHLLHKQHHSHQNNLRKSTIEVPIIIGEDKHYHPSKTPNTVPEHNEIEERKAKKYSKESSEAEDDSIDKEINEEEMKAKDAGEKQNTKKPFEWNKWSIFIFALLFLIPITVAIIFFCISKNTNDNKEQNTAFIVDEQVKKDSMEKELPFVLNEPDVNNYSRRSKNADIQRLSQNLDGYFNNSTKPSISEEKENMEEHTQPRPVGSVIENDRRQSLVEQQMSSSEDAM